MLTIVDGDFGQNTGAKIEKSLFGSFRAIVIPWFLFLHHKIKRQDIASVMPAESEETPESGGGGAGQLVAGALVAG